MNIGEKLSLLSVTHYAPRESYGRLSPPSDGIIKRTINSFENNMESLQDCTYYIIHNEVKNYSNNKRAQQYYQNISKYSKENDAILIIKKNEGLRKALLTGINQIDTKYILFVEHDWELIKHVNIVGIIRALDDNDEMNSIRFNRGKNIEGGWDTHIIEDTFKPIPVCKSSNAGNQPQIVRKKTLREWIRISNPNIISAAKSCYCHYDTLQDIITFGKSLYNRYIKERPARYFNDVEKILDAKYKKEINRRGFQEAHNNWGIYYYGYEGEGPYVRHLGR